MLCMRGHESILAVDKFSACTNLVKFNSFEIQFKPFMFETERFRYLSIFTEKLILHKSETARLIGTTCLQLIEHESFVPFIFMVLYCNVLSMQGQLWYLNYTRV